MFGIRIKKIALVLLAICLLIPLCACGEKEEPVSEISEERFFNKPEIEQIRSICTLATLECYYHNVAKAVKPAGSGFTHIGEVDRTFWIEYTGVAKIGIDMSEVTMDISEKEVTITIPDAKLLSINVDKATFNEDSFVFSEDAWNENKITSDDQTTAIRNAQETMKHTVETDKSLMITAQSRAMILIEKYINQLGEIAGIEYKINWVTSNGTIIMKSEASDSESSKAD